jgi:predicted metal-binding protein
MCTLPYWTIYRDKKGSAFRRFDKCPGYGWLPGCPPNSASVEKVQKILDRSDLFIVLQTRLQSERWDTGWKFAVLHKLANDIENLLGKNSVTGKYGSGPCTACKAQYCLSNRPCKSPRLKTASLEAMGICVEMLCNDLALLSNQNAWKIKWLKHFGLPKQTPKKWKYVVAISVKLPKSVK